MPPVCAVTCSMRTLSSNDVVPKTLKKSVMLNLYCLCQLNFYQCHAKLVIDQRTDPSLKELFEHAMSPSKVRKNVILSMMVC